MDDRIARMTPSPSAPSPDDDVVDKVGHPKGTLVIVLIFGLLFAAGWFAFFLFRFMEQGAPHSH
jgi:hypothetical protein